VIGVLLFGYLSNMLSKKTKYGLKALAYLGSQKEKNPIQISEIAEHENISQKFLESILLSLRKTGFLGSKKGKGGGYYLLRPPEEISMIDVMRVLEGPIAMVPCVSLNFYETCDDCPNERNCSVHKLMLQIRDSALEVYRNNSLRDIIG
jgi:Rrf2 family protein